MRRFGILVASGIFLSGCQSNYAYQPIVANAPNLEMTHAKCEMLSSSTQQGYIAYGSQAYVTGAAIGNALGNAVAADNFIRQCMAINGWRRVAKQEQAQSASAQQPAAGLTPAQTKQAIDVLAMARVAEACKISIKSEKRRDVDDLRQAVGGDVRAQGRALGDKTFNDNAKNVGRSEVCKRASGALKDMGWL